MIISGERTITAMFHRMHAALQALGYDPARLKVILRQMVRLIAGQ